MFASVECLHLPSQLHPINLSGVPLADGNSSPLLRRKQRFTAVYFNLASLNGSHLQHSHLFDGNQQKSHVTNSPGNLNQIISRLGHETDVATYDSLLQRCTIERALSEGERLHEHIIRCGYSDNGFLNNLLLQMYGKCGSLQHVRAVFNSMVNPDLYSWTIILAASAQNGSLDDARAVFAEMPQRDVVSWNAIIAACAQNGQGKEALQLFGQMQVEGIEPSKISFISILDACASVAALEEGREIHANVVGNGWECVVVGNALVNMYGKCRSLDDARAVFVEMPSQNVISWNAMIAACAQNGHGKESLQLFGQMQAKGFKPDEITFICVLDACAIMVALEEGRDIHTSIVCNAWVSDVVLGNALINMYGKCGTLDDAKAVFAEMPRKNVVSWSAMIAVCSQNGHGEEALRLHGQMQAEGIKPDDITFRCVLTACSRMGLVVDGMQYFRSMSQDHAISPSMDHYVCMIDLLGRAGLLDKAEQLINTMPFKPVASAWSSLLSSCRIHGDVERGVRAASHLFDFDEKKASPYVLLASIHAAAGRWDDVEKVKVSMIEKGVKKSPGHSCIEVNSVVHEFIAGDSTHPHLARIYSELQQLGRQMEEAGYVFDINALQRVLDEEDEENMMCYHTEKLAITFGLISTPPGTTIRITKNLRVCSACHSAIKFVSKIVQRKIFVRDANCFHHIEHGVCSCGDCW